MPYLSNKHIIAIRDSWYAKRPFLMVIDKFDNLDVICNVRIDIIMYYLPLEDKSGRGKNPKYRNRITPDDFIKSDYKIGKILYRLYKGYCYHDRNVIAYITMPDKNTNKSRRLFINTIRFHIIHTAFSWYEESPLNSVGSYKMVYVPLILSLEYRSQLLRL
ncbi:TPA: hypothetical protein JRS23_004404 [Escherichia coli]|nr:hypothetical protein [Escherichia coli]